MHGTPRRHPNALTPDAQSDAGARALWADIQHCTTNEAKERLSFILENFRNVYRRVVRLMIEAAFNSPQSPIGD
jgi:hypothetical protein